MFGIVDMGTLYNLRKNYFSAFDYIITYIIIQLDFVFLYFDFEIIYVH